MADVARPARTVTVSGANLFELSARMLGDATQAYRIAELNALVDFFVDGQATLALPPVDDGLTGGVPPQ